MKSQNRFRLLIENFIVFGGAATLGKIIPFVMLPIVTRILNSTEEYGIYEVFSTIVSLGCVFSNLSMNSGVFREYFEDEDDKKKKKVVSTAIILVFFAAVFMMLCITIFSKFVSNLYFGSGKYINVVLLAAICIFLESTFYIWSVPIRIDNNKKIFVLINLLQSILFYAVSIMLLFLDMMSTSLMLGTMMGYLFCNLLCFYYCRNRFKICFFDKEIAKKLLFVSLPLIPGAAIYWIFNSLDRVMITHMMDLDAVGIYSIGAKVASVAGVVYMAFGNGWQFFSFSTMKDNDQVEMTSDIFKVLSGVVTVVFLCSLLVYKQFFSIFFEEQYVYGYTVFPYLFLAPLLLMLYQSVANQFLIARKSYLSTLMLTCGAIVNVVLNYILIKLLGIKGAAIATIIGYTITIIISLFALCKMKLLLIRKEVVLSLSILFAGFFIVELGKKYIFILLYVICGSIILGYLFHKELKYVWGKIHHE